MFDRASEFAGEVRTEMGKVTWPTREELLESTWVVLVTITLVTAFIFVIDYILRNLIQALIGAVV